MNKHIEITRHLTVDGTTTYYVVEKSKNASSIIWNGTCKQAAYQVAQRNARKENTPLYDTLYKAEFDRNGVKHIIPIGNERFEVNN